MIRKAVFVMALALLRSVLAAQAGAPGTGLIPFGSYHGGNIDHVNLLNLSVNLYTPVLSYKQRGDLSLNYALSYNSPAQRLNPNVCKGSDGCFEAYYLDHDPYYGEPSVQFYRDDVLHWTSSIRTAGAGGQFGNAKQVVTYSLVTPDGGLHPLANIGNGVWRSADATGYLFYTLNSAFLAYDRHGNTHYNYSNLLDSSGNYNQNSPLEEDTNGNQIQFGYDTAGRSLNNTTDYFDINNEPQACSGISSYLYATKAHLPGKANTTFDVLYCFGSPTIHLGPAAWSNRDSSGNLVNDWSGFIALERVVLPDGSTWQFVYDDRDSGDLQSINYGSLTKVVTPSGGTISYKYLWTVPVGGERYLASRSVDAGDGSGPHTWTYSQTYSVQDSSYTTTVTGPPTRMSSSGDDTVHIFTKLCGTLSRYETEVDYYQGTGANRVLLKKENKNYDCLSAANVNPDPASGWEINADVINVVPTGIVTTYGNATDASVRETMSYDQGASFSVNGYNLHYGLQSTDTIYASDNSVLLDTEKSYKAFADNSYLSSNQLDRVSYSIVTGAGGGTHETWYQYDETTTPPKGITCSYDTSRYPNNAGTTLSRGNLTSITSGMITTRTFYDPNGVPYETVDGNNNPSCLTSDSTGAFIASVQDAAGNTSYSSYDIGSSKLVSSTDINGRMISVSYDSMWRPIQLMLPEESNGQGGQKKWAWSSNTHVDAQVKQSANVWLDHQVWFDGLSRTSKVFDGASYVDTSYDPFDRVDTVSNPYLAGATTSGNTVYSYDALGRVVQVSNQDGSIQYTCYNGTSIGQPKNACRTRIVDGLTTWVDQTDENNNSRQLAYDSLGRLVSVVEPGNNITKYSYDAFGNLLSVQQKGNGTTDAVRARSYSYDSLSRLITAVNSESGTTCYGTMSTSGCKSGYDGNGNLLVKTDARGIETHYRYDVLNRMTAKYYRNASTGSASNCYAYDNTNSAANGVGRLWFEWTQTGDCPSSPPTSIPTVYQTLRVIGAYDTQGRAVSEQQCVAGYCTSTSVPAAPTPNCSSLSASSGLQFCYDLAGNLLVYTSGVPVTAVASFPQASMAFSQTFDTVGKLATVSSSLSDTSHPIVLFNALGYAPSGALSNWQLGASLFTARNYDSRQRVCRQLSSVGQTTAAAQCGQ